jgi:signal peptidase I
VKKFSSSGGFSSSETEKEILQECQKKFFPLDVNSPLPTTTQCLKVTQALTLGIEKLSELNVSDQDVQSLARCAEVMQAFYVSSRTMQPSLQLGDHIITDRTAYQTQLPQRGDIVVFKTPQAASEICRSDKEAFFIKRIIGLPGEQISVSKKRVYINNQPIEERYIQQVSTYEYSSRVVPQKSYFVLGDNRNISCDSHIWGFVSHDAIIGKVIWRYFPPKRSGAISP